MICVRWFQNKSKDEWDEWQEEDDAQVQPKQQPNHYAPSIPQQQIPTIHQTTPSTVPPIMSDWYSDSEESSNFRWYSQYLGMVGIGVFLYLIFLMVGFFSTEFQNGVGHISSPTERLAQSYLKHVHVIVSDVEQLPTQLVAYDQENAKWQREYAGLTAKLKAQREDLVHTELPLSMNLLHESLIALNVKKGEWAGDSLLSLAYQLIEAYKQDYRTEKRVHFEKKKNEFQKKLEIVKKDINDLSKEYNLELK